MKTDPGRAVAEGESTDGTARPGSRRPADPVAKAERRAGLAYCLKVFAAMRIGLTVIALVSVALLPDLSRLSPAVRQGLPAIPGPVDVPGWPAHAVSPGPHNLFTSWERFDALWYLRIADSGYRDGDGSAAFFPLYPLVTRGVSTVIGGHPLAAGLLVSNASFLAALMVLYLLTRAEFQDEDLARRTVLFTAVFPTALFFLAPYSESMFLLLVLVALWGARRSNWLVAAAAGFLAALTRNMGVLLTLPLLVEAVHQAVLARPRRWPFPEVLAAAGPLAGLGVYLAFWRHLAGDWLAPLHQQAFWERHLQNPISTVGKGTHEAFRWIGIYPGGYHLLDWMVAVPVLAAAIYAVVKFRPSYSVYAWVSILIPLCYIFTGRPLMSFPRFALPIFPVFWAFGRWTGPSRARLELVVGASAALLGVMTLLFVNWYYVF